MNASGGRWWRASASALLAAVVSCSPSPERARGTGPLRAGLQSYPASLSLIGNTDRNSEIIAALITESLVAYDARLAIQPRLARSWDVSSDGLTWTFHLRDGVLWHDGVAVTAQDVVFTVEKVRDPATQSRSYLSQFQDLVSIEAVDPLTVRARYAIPYADALDSWTLPIVPRHRAGADPDLLTGEFARHPVGCGAFRVKSLDPGREIVLEANERFWEGRPGLDGIVLRILPEERTAFEALLLGDLDLMMVTADFWKEAQGAPGARRLARFVSYPLSAWYIGWNQDGSNQFFLDPRVRRAMVMALDRPRFISRVLSDLARPAVGTWHPDSPWFDGSLAPWPFDPAAAGTLLDEAGWRDSDEDGLRDRDGVAFSFQLMIAASSQEMTNRMAAWVQESLAQIGVEMTIEKLEWRAFQERRRAHRFQAAMASLIFGPVPDQFELYHSASRERGLNYVGFHDEEVDRLLVEGRRTFDARTRLEIYHRIQRRIHDLEPISPLFHFAAPVLYDARLLGLEASARGVWLIAPGPRRWRWTPPPGGD